MNRLRHYQVPLVLVTLTMGVSLLVAAVLLAQGTPNKSLVVNGQPTDATVRQIDGRSYVDIEALAQITNGSVTIEPNRIVLTIPVNSAGATTAPAPPPPPAPVPVGLSRSFASTAVTVLADMREWRGAVGTILTYGVPVVGTWPQDYHNRAESNLEQAAVAASTESDQQALALLRNEFANVDAWANDVVSTRNALDATDTVRPDVMQNDPLVAKVSDCSRFLASMLVSGVFADNASCH